MSKNLKDLLFPEIKTELLATIVEKIAGTLMKRFSDFEKKCIANHLGEVSTELLKGEVWKIILEKRNALKDRDNINFSFLYTIVKNHFLDTYVKKKIISAETETDIKNRISTTSETEAEPLGAEIFSLMDTEYVKRIFILELIDIVTKELSERELEILCWNIHRARKEENPFLKRMSSDAKYKAWNRLKPKLAEIFKKCGGVNEEEFFLFCEIFSSEICTEFR